MKYNKSQTSFSITNPEEINELRRENGFIIFEENAELDFTWKQFDKSIRMLKWLKWSVQTAYKELINLLVVVQTTPSIGKEISAMIISLECKVNTLNVSINEFFDDMEIDNKNLK